MRPRYGLAAPSIIIAWEMGHIVIDAQRSVLNRLYALLWVVLHAVNDTTDRVGFHRVGAIRPE